MNQNNTEQTFETFRFGEMRESVFFVELFLDKTLNIEANLCVIGQSQLLIEKPKMQMTFLKG